jgi:AcrR family transcriptional regulator
MARRLESAVDTRTALIEVATALFGEQGVEATSVHAVVYATSLALPAAQRAALSHADDPGGA